MITLAQIHALACRWASPEAAYENLLVDVVCWGPAHELGHALIAGRRGRNRGYGLCSWWCVCYRDRCTIIEAAAMIVSSTLLRRAGHRDLITKERHGTEGLNAIDEVRPRGKLLLIERGIWPLPLDADGLEQLAARRIGVRNAMPEPIACGDLFGALGGRSAVSG